MSPGAAAEQTLPAGQGQFESLPPQVSSMSVPQILLHVFTLQQAETPPPL